MTNKEFARICSRITSLFPNAFKANDAIDIWFKALEPYEDKDVSAAVDSYLHSKPFPPKPADIIALIPNRPRQTTQSWQRGRIEMGENGKTYRVFKCLECMDSGLITWRDKKDNMIGKPCKCSAGKERYTAAYQKYYGG